MVWNIEMQAAARKNIFSNPIIALKGRLVWLLASLRFGAASRRTNAATPWSSGQNKLC
jgi:hypothetical protein